jgi:hypothetical protein
MSSRQHISKPSLHLNPTTSIFHQHSRPIIYKIHRLCRICVECWALCLRLGSRSPPMAMISSTVIRRLYPPSRIAAPFATELVAADRGFQVSVSGLTGRASDGGSEACERFHHRSPPLPSTSSQVSVLRSRFGAIARV